MNTTLKNIVRLIVGGRRYDYLMYCRHHRMLMRLNGFANRHADGEEAYVAKWSRLAKHVEPYSYRLFSHYCGPTPDIVPENILHDVVEKALSPMQYWEEYEDKNNFARVVGAEWLPQTVASCQHGILQGSLDRLADSPFQSLILKASTGTSCGKGILKFNRVGERYVASDGRELAAVLQSYGDDYVLQECVEQHPFLARFNASSVNTIRIATYRSPSDGQVHLTAAVLRIGCDGSWVDNIMAGGRFVAVDVATGCLGNTAFARKGIPSAVWNGIDFASESMTVPHWDEICRLAVHVGERLSQARLAALDIALRADGRPVLIEYNIGGFSSYLFHFTGQTLFGPYTDEVIDYCSIPQAPALR